MTHKKTHMKTIKITIVATAMLFGLAACDSGTNDATDVAEVYTGTDYSLVISAEEVKNGVAFGDLVMGNPDAPVTIIEYASLTCQHCANFHLNTWPDLKEKYIKTGQVRFIYRNYTRDPADLAVGMLTRCVGPDQAFDLMSIFFERQRQWVVQDAKTEIAAIARRVGINRVDFDACLANTELQAQLVEMLRVGQAEGVSGTPTFLINGERHVGFIEFEALSEIIEDNM